MTKTDFGQNRLLQGWLLLCALMVAVMVPFGGDAADRIGAVDR
jgi:hypothetical protein